MALLCKKWLACPLFCRRWSRRKTAPCCCLLVTCSSWSLLCLPQPAKAAHTSSCSGHNYEYSSKAFSCLLTRLCSCVLTQAEELASQNQDFLQTVTGPPYGHLWKCQDSSLGFLKSFSGMDNRTYRKVNIKTALELEHLQGIRSQGFSVTNSVQLSYGCCKSQYSEKVKKAIKETKD